MSNIIRIKILIENTACGHHILAEHGISFWIDTGAHHLLFDTGQGLPMFFPEMQKGFKFAWIKPMPLRSAMAIMTIPVDWSTLWPFYGGRPDPLQNNAASIAFSVSWVEPRKKR